MKIKQYFEYLLYIGVILPENKEQMKIKIQNFIKEKSEKKGKNLIENLIGDYFTSLDKESLNKLGLNIYEQYNKNRLLTISKHLKKVFNILQNIFFRKIKYCFNILKNKNDFELISDINNISNKYSRSQSSGKLNEYNINIGNSKNSNYNNNLEESNKKFFERMNSFNTKKENNKKYQQSLKEEEYNFICTFSPDLSLTKKRNSQKKFTPSKKSIENIEEEKPKRKVDNQRMMKLYNDYQQTIIKKQKLSENIDKENGITFSPKLNKESKYNKNIRDNFMQRNQKLLTDKKNFVDGFNLLRDLQMKGVDINTISIDISKNK